MATVFDSGQPLNAVPQPILPARPGLGCICHLNRFQLEWRSLPTNKFSVTRAIIPAALFASGHRTTRMSGELQRREVRAWKSSKLHTLLQHGGTWKRVRQLHNVAMQRTTEQPPPDAFADMLKGIFNGSPGAPTQPEQLHEPLWAC